MTPWHACRLHLAGGGAPVRVGVSGRLAARVPLLVGWAEGDRRRVVRVVDERGGDVTPASVDWSGIPGGEPERRVGRPETGRDAQTIIRSTEEQRDAWRAAAERAGVAIGAWVRAALDDTARQK
jgi:hypothetical protein